MNLWYVCQSYSIFWKCWINLNNKWEIWSHLCCNVLVFYFLHSDNARKLFLGKQKPICINLSIYLILRITRPLINALVVWNYIRINSTFEPLLLFHPSMYFPPPPVSLFLSCACHLAWLTKAHGEKHSCRLNKSFH